MAPEQGATPKPSTLFLKWADDYFIAPQDAVTMGNLWDAWRTAISTSRNGKMLLALEQSRDDANADSVRLLHEKLAALSRAEAAEARAGRLEEALKDAEEYLRPRIAGTNGHGETVVLPKMRAALADAPSNWLRDRLREERAKERERCAVICDTWQHCMGAGTLADSIRALPEGE